MQWLEPTGKTRLIRYGDREILFHNQKSADWTHPYGYGEEKSDLCGAGCGIFAIAHAVEWMTGRRIDVEALADFSVQNGGRDDTGTDRPALLSAMQRAGAVHAATGENPVVRGVMDADVVLGPLGIVVAHAILGEVTPKIAEAVGGCRAKKFLVPMNSCGVVVAGVQELGLAAHVRLAVDQAEAYLNRKDAGGL